MFRGFDIAGVGSGFGRVISRTGGGTLSGASMNVILGSGSPRGCGGN